jgi:hypothetical protein
MGRMDGPCEVVGETPTRYRIRPTIRRLKLGGRQRWLELGEVGLVPKSAVKFIGIDPGTAP